MIETSIMTERGVPMLASSLVENPVKPEDATHLSPAGDYWQITADEETHRAECSIWDGEKWHRDDVLFVRGLHLGICFESVGDSGLPPISLVHLAVTRLALRWALN